MSHLDSLWYFHDFCIIYVFKLERHYSPCCVIYDVLVNMVDRKIQVHDMLAKFLHVVITLRHHHWTFLPRVSGFKSSLYIYCCRWGILWCTDHVVGRAHECANHAMLLGMWLILMKGICFPFEVAVSHYAICYAKCAEPRAVIYSSCAAFTSHIITPCEYGVFRSYACGMKGVNGPRRALLGSGGDVSVLDSSEKGRINQFGWFGRDIARASCPLIVASTSR